MDELLSNKIAAGEVVEKVVSIVKELVENSIDAKATMIKVDLKEAGLREITVTDNGIGMDKNDAQLAFQRHATSKLYTDDDLFNINSLGFRGEALPSIAAVSDVVLKTCQDDVGTQIHIKGGKHEQRTKQNQRSKGHRGPSLQKVGRQRLLPCRGRPQQKTIHNRDATTKHHRTAAHGTCP